MARTEDSAFEVAASTGQLMLHHPPVTWREMVPNTSTSASLYTERFALPLRWWLGLTRIPAYIACFASA